MTSYKIEKTILPFEGTKWIIRDQKNGEIFGTHKTRKEAEAEAKEYGLTIVR